MNQNISTTWTLTVRFLFRLVFCYLIFYFVFLSNYFVSFFSFLEKIHTPLQYISDQFVGLINRILIHKKFEANIYTGAGDTSWFCIAILSYLILAILTTTIWTIFSKRNNDLKLFNSLQLYARFYLAAVLFFYGFGKVFNAQFFDPTPINLMQPLGNVDPHSLLWTFMSASKLYNFFGGLVEVVAGALLLINRTRVLGALITIATLLNVLMLDIGYDTYVKAYLVHFILIGFFIVSLNIKRLINFFLFNKTTSLTSIPSATVNKKLNWITHILKFIVIAYVVFTSVKVAIEIFSNYSKPYFGGIDGIYSIIDFERSSKNSRQISADTTHWQKIAMNKFGEIAVKYLNDSVAYYTVKVDTATKTLTLSSWNDSTFESNLKYSIRKADEYVFEGTYKNDSIHFSSRKVDLQKYPLLKDKGVVKWISW